MSNKKFIDEILTNDFLEFSKEVREEGIHSQDGLRIQNIINCFDLEHIDVSDIDQFFKSSINKTIIIYDKEINGHIIKLSKHPSHVYYYLSSHYFDLLFKKDINNEIEMNRRFKFYLNILNNSTFQINNRFAKILATTEENIETEMFITENILMLRMSFKQNQYLINEDFDNSNNFIYASNQILNLLNIILNFTIFFIPKISKHLGDRYLMNKFKIHAFYSINLHIFLEEHYIPGKTPSIQDYINFECQDPKL